MRWSDAQSCSRASPWMRPRMSTPANTSRSMFLRSQTHGNAGAMTPAAHAADHAGAILSTCDNHDAAA
jgi:hypothetical protein